MITNIPAPPNSLSTFSLGPLTIHMYAICILAGIFFAIWLTGKRWVERGGDREVVSEIAFWAVPFGIVGGRLYHVITSPQQYFGEGGKPLDAFKIWEGGLGIWGAIALGVLGAYLACRKHQVSFTAFLDSVAPGVILAQAIGRLGNYFNQEVFGGPTDLPWALEVDPQYVPAGYAAGTTFHPTFLYELLWCVLAAGVLIWADKRFHLWGGRTFILYVALYTVGRLWIENLRIDEANHIAGLRLNVWVSILVFTLAVVAFVLIGKRQRAQENTPARAELAHNGVSSQAALMTGSADSDDQREVKRSTD